MDGRLNLISVLPISRTARKPSRCGKIVRDGGAWAGLVSRVEASKNIQPQMRVRMCRLVVGATTALCPRENSRDVILAAREALRVARVAATVRSQNWMLTALARDPHLSRPTVALPLATCGTPVRVYARCHRISVLDTYLLTGSVKP